MKKKKKDFCDFLSFHLRKAKQKKDFIDFFVALTCKIIDRDGDGKLSIEDFVALLMVCSLCCKKMKIISL